MILGFADAHGVDAHQNLLIVGPTGAGKTFVACALAQAAVRCGHTAFYVRAPRLLDDLDIAHGDGRWARLMTAWARIDVLLIDDPGGRPARGDRGSQPASLDHHHQPAAGGELVTRRSVTRPLPMRSSIASPTTPTASSCAATPCAVHVLKPVQTNQTHRVDGHGRPRPPLERLRGPLTASDDIQHVGDSPVLRARWHNPSDPTIQEEVTARGLPLTMSPLLRSRRSQGDRFPPKQVIAFSRTD